MKLTLIERLALPSICPEKDNIDRLLIRKSILAKTDLTPEQSKELELKQEGQQLFWKKGVKAAEDIDVKFSEIEANYLRSCMNELSNKKELHASMIDLYQKVKG